MIGQTFRQYRIVAKIGAGGMGEVYRARDERLEREVALKVLPASALADDGARKRFRKEALALSKLNHPNIATIYDFDSESGIDFLAMEYVPGETLANRVGGRPLSEKEVVALSSQIADALEEAHEHGIVHRDLKPGNIMVTPKGRAKVLDFGLARLLRPGANLAGNDTVSLAQGVSGTLPYMAPEQLHDEPPDPRSDIFSLGAVIYELATGRRAFTETIQARLTEAILRHEPVLPRALNPQLSPELERIILKCLEKGPDLRYQSAKELGVDLRRLNASTAVAIPAATGGGRVRYGRAAYAAAFGILAVLVIAILAWWNKGGGSIIYGRYVANAPTVHALAVLPLANLSADPAQEYFADGMTEELTTELAQISGLRVVSRTSTMRYKGTQKSLAEIAQDLHADTVIEGSIERSGDEVRITAQLINARTDTHLWAHSYKRELRDVLALQSEVARAIAEEIQVQLTPRERERFGHSRPVDPAAYEAYLKGLYHWNFHTSGELQKAIAEYQRAIQLDPGYALAYVGVASAYELLPLNGDVAPQQALPKAKEYALQAIELDPQLSEAHCALAFALGQYDWGWTDAEREFKRAIELSPSNAVARALYARMSSIQRRHAEAISEATRARELDPISGQIGLQLSAAYFYARQYERSVDAFHRALENNPNLWPLHYFLGQVYEQQGLFRDAIVEFQKAQGPTLLATSGMGHLFAISGRRSDAEKILSDLALRSKTGYIPPTYLARVYVGLGERGQALEWLEKGYAARDSHMAFLGVEPAFDPLRSDPRFVDLLRRLHLAQ
jgi:TolB-like protein/tRNA A-37 threonylcarbamoyl transferase component Bud32/Tfp pilus assembly protein PilF